MFSERLSQLRDFTQQRQYQQFRTEIDNHYTKLLDKTGYNFAQRSAFILKEMCQTEDAVVFPDERIAFIRTKQNIPTYYRGKSIKKEFPQKKGISYDTFHNVCPDYEILLTNGLEKLREEVLSERKKTKKRSEKIFLDSVSSSILAVLQLAEKYHKAALIANNQEVADLFNRVPRYPAQTFHEGLQAIRFVSAALYLADTYQLGFGRMDQYLYPLYENDIKTGKISREEAKELLAEFFISLNKDTDLYRGVQQGDNGQSVMLGGCKPSDGTSAVNDLTYLILEVSKDLKLIDPKINLRIDSNTPDDLLELGCELTKCGLGFPQYSNDEIVIPALVKKGYSLEDARNYTVAACWEFIIPGKGMDVVNQGAVSFPYAVDFAFEKCMKKGNSFNVDSFRKQIKQSIKEQVKNILLKRDIRTLPCPFASVFFHDSIQQRKDASQCAKYNNIGIHGAGSANGADALIAILKTFETKGFSGLKELLTAKNANFKGYEQLRTYLQDEMPKVGNAKTEVDNELKFLFDCFADVADELSTKQRKLRAGSGSAMFYVWLVDPNMTWAFEPKVNATADGRLSGEALSTSLAPSHGIKVNGVLSVLKSYSVIDYSRIMNGGPITIELSPSVFHSEDGIKKLAQLIKYFVKVGNQQLQLNVLDASVLEEAIAHPEKHRNLIVRVWGWSGYFTELAPVYQQHVLNRHKYTL
ncbi:MAG: pyruvate formate-lyase [Alphaproteobacteria bacterium]|nr:pyruvate formate-lyase [Alphaproteobacteria bacterium]